MSVTVTDSVLRDSSLFRVSSRRVHAVSFSLAGENSVKGEGKSADEWRSLPGLAAPVNDVPHVWDKRGTSPYA